MALCIGNVVCSCDNTKNSASEYRYPYLKKDFRNITPAETHHKSCIENRIACSISHPTSQECLGTSRHYEHSKNFKETEQDHHLHCVAHSCPLGKVVCCTECTKNGCNDERNIIKAEDISHTQEGIICQPVSHQTQISDDITVSRERHCCAKNTSSTEPGICRCDPCGYLKHCQCQCASALLTEPQQEKPKKTVRFADEEVKCEDREKAFRNLDTEDVKHLCCCCRECAVIGKEQCIGRQVLVYELPEHKLEDTSVTQKDFCYQKIPPREVPPWHPNVKDRWRPLDVPSQSETIYQCDFKPPAVILAERKPVYLAPHREKSDPCQELAEEYCSWKKTSMGERHTYNSPCDECHKDPQRLHLYECDVAHLSPQCHCHGHNHINQPLCHSTEEKFTFCERGDAGDSRHCEHAQRTCCIPEKEYVCQKLIHLPPDLMKPVCPPYTTSYMHDFKNPHRLQTEMLDFGNCRACEPCTRPPREKQPNLLCTKDTRQDFITQNVEII